MECVRGKKGSLGGVRQLFLQQLRQRRGRRQEGARRRSDSHHGNRDHKGRQGDPSTHRRCQERAGVLQQVRALRVPFAALSFFWILKESLSLSPPPPNFPSHNPTSTSSVCLLLLPSFCLFPPLTSHTRRVFKPAVRRYVLQKLFVLIACCIGTGCSVMYFFSHSISGFGGPAHASLEQQLPLA